MINIVLIIIASFLYLNRVECIQCHICSNRFSWDFCQPGATIQCPDYMDACATSFSQGRVNPFEERSQFTQLYLRQCIRKSQCNNNAPLCDGHTDCKVKCCFADFCNDD
ncbi:hypothetical protein MXB_2442 [Myxobolus squamalis]|nr:hypothetical protein MXB_2442 [Myxobolus squamalis]